MKRLIFATLFCFTCGTFSYGSSFEEQLVITQIAVEKQTGRGDNYEAGFSGSVGSLSVDVASKRIYISEFLDVGINSPHIMNTSYEITMLNKFPHSIDFECVDKTMGTLGQQWRGKIWETDSGAVKVEMVMKDSPRRWVNLGEFGKRWLRENKLSHLNLGC